MWRAQILHRNVLKLFRNHLFSQMANHLAIFQCCSKRLQLLSNSPWVWERYGAATWHVICDCYEWGNEIKWNVIVLQKSPCSAIPLTPAEPGWMVRCNISGQMRQHKSTVNCCDLQSNISDIAPHQIEYIFYFATILQPYVYWLCCGQFGTIFVYNFVRAHRKQCAYTLHTYLRNRYMVCLVPPSMVYFANHVFHVLLRLHCECCAAPVSKMSRTRAFYLINY